MDFSRIVIDHVGYTFVVRVNTGRGRPEVHVFLNRRGLLRFLQRTISGGDYAEPDTQAQSEATDGDDEMTVQIHEE